jgi:hypothetical protein
MIRGDHFTLLSILVSSLLFFSSFLFFIISSPVTYTSCSISKSAKLLMYVHTCDLKGCPWWCCRVVGSRAECAPSLRSALGTYLTYSSSFRVSACRFRGILIKMNDVRLSHGDFLFSYVFFPFCSVIEKLLPNLALWLHARHLSMSNNKACLTSKEKGGSQVDTSR